ncbi:MAG: hypothetical protein KH135_00910 [Firmicutes bacterium]|nr:hypothetical protein [Bacillota bacterium]
MNLKEILKTRDMSYYSEIIQDMVQREEELDSAILIQKKRNDTLYEFYKQFYDDPQEDYLKVVNLEKEFYDKTKELRKNDDLLPFEKLYFDMYDSMYMKGLEYLIQDFKTVDLNIILPREDTDVLTEEEKQLYYAALIYENGLLRQRVEAINGTVLAFLLADYGRISKTSKTKLLNILKEEKLRPGVYDNVKMQLDEFQK